MAEDNLNKLYLIKIFLKLLEDYLIKEMPDQFVSDKNFLDNADELLKKREFFEKCFEKCWELTARKLAHIKGA